MESGNIQTPLKDVIEELKDYIDNLIIYNKLVFVRGASELSSYLMLLVVLFGVSGFVLLFLSFAFAGWFGDITDLGIGAGYLVVALFYLIISIVVYRFRKPLIFNPSRKLFGSILFGEYDEKGKDFKFESEDTQNENITKVKELLSKQKDNLNEKVKILEAKLTFSNIFQEIIGKAYSSIATTSNIARFAFNLISKLKGSGRKKKKKTKDQKLLKDRIKDKED